MPESGLEGAVAAYADDVRARRFPGPEHCFGAKPTSSTVGPAGSPDPETPGKGPLRRVNVKAG